MAVSEDPLDVLIIPTGTIAEERDLVTTGDVIIGGQSNINFGVRSHETWGRTRDLRGGVCSVEQLVMH